MKFTKICCLSPSCGEMHYINNALAVPGVNPAPLQNSWGSGVCGLLCWDRQEESWVSAKRSSDLHLTCCWMLPEGRIRLLENRNSPENSSGQLYPWHFCWRKVPLKSNLREEEGTGKLLVRLRLNSLLFFKVSLWQVRLGEPKQPLLLRSEVPK